MSISGSDLVQKMPNELWVFTLFATGVLEICDVVEFFLCSKGTAKFGKAIVQDRYTFRKLYTLVPLRVLAKKGFSDPFIDRIDSGFEKPDENRYSLLVSLLQHKETEQLRHAALKLIPDLTREENARALQKALDNAKNHILEYLLRRNHAMGNSTSLKQESIIFHISIGYKNRTLFDYLVHYLEGYPQNYVRPAFYQQIMEFVCIAGNPYHARQLWFKCGNQNMQRFLNLAVQNNNQPMAFFIKEKLEGNFDCTKIDIKTLKHLLRRADLEFVQTFFSWIDLDLLQVENQTTYRWLVDEAYVYCAGLSTREVFDFIQEKFSVDQSEAFLNACKRNQIWAVDYFIRLSLQDDATKEQKTMIYQKDNLAFREAAKRGHVTVAKRLLQHPRVIANSHSSYALRKAAENGHFEMVKFLVEEQHIMNHRCNIKAKDCWAIRKAIENNHAKIVLYLCRKAKMDIEDFL